MCEVVNALVTVVVTHGEWTWDYIRDSDCTGDCIDDCTVDYTGNCSDDCTDEYTGNCSDDCSDDYTGNYAGVFA